MSEDSVIATIGDGSPWIAIVGPSCFPDGGAAARRILGNAQSLVSGGYSVVIVSGQFSQSGPELKEYAPSIYVVSVCERDAEHLPRLLRLLRYSLMGRRTRLWLDAQTAPASVILYSGYSPYLLQLTGWCRRRGIPLIFDAVEWYSASSWIGLFLSPYLWNIEFAMRVLNKRLSGVIAISSWLAEYYQKAGNLVEIVPPTLDTAAVIPRIDSGFSSVMTLAYCGSPGKKDLLREIIEAVLHIDPEGKVLRLHIAGVESHMIAGMDLMKFQSGILPTNALKFHGKVSQLEAMNIVRSADFSVFLRGINRVSTAGFPTKFVESLSVGTPVITNFTSDLNLYLHDGETGFVCSEPTVKSLVAVLRRALELGEKGRIAMRLASRQTAEEAFDFRHYTDELTRLVRKPNQ